MKAKSSLILFLALFIAGCIGTDFLEENADFVDPRIEITPEVSAVEIGEAITFSAVYYDSTDFPVTTTFEWNSSDAGIAAIDATGAVTGVAMGQTRITASAFGISSEQALLSVVSDPAQVAFVEVTPSDTSLTVRQSIQFSAVALNASREELAGEPIAWRTSDELLATVDDQGLVTSIEPGMVQIIASSGQIESSPINLEIFAMSREGTFRAAPNTSYTVKGKAILEQIMGGNLRLRFDEDFQSSNGPDLNVYLSTESRVNATSLHLGQLMATRGEQTYTIPPFVEMNDFDHVIIHCLPFNVTFGSAPLR